MSNNCIPKIIYDDKNIIVAEKPAGFPSQADKTNDENMLSELSKQLTTEVFLVHRLDRPVGGIMVFAKNKKACSSLSMQVQDKTFKKTYHAITCGIPKENSKTLIDYMQKNQRLNISKIVQKNMPNAKMAELSYEVQKTIETSEYGSLALLKINLKTGRHHQIRLQLSNAGFPIWGDTKYNDIFKKRGGFVNIALFASSITFKNPTTNTLETYSLPLPNAVPFSLLT